MINNILDCGPMRLKNFKSYIVAVIILMISLSYIIFYTSFVEDYDSVAVGKITNQMDGSRVLISGIVDDVVENGFYVCEYDECIKVTGNYEEIIYPGDKVTVCGTISSYKGQKFIRIDRLMQN